MSIIYHDLYCYNCCDFLEFNTEDKTKRLIFNEVSLLINNKPVYACNLWRKVINKDKKACELYKE